MASPRFTSDGEVQLISGIGEIELKLDFRLVPDTESSVEPSSFHSKSCLRSVLPLYVKAEALHLVNIT